jgi:predicted transcriptional regulator
MVDPDQATRLILDARKKQAEFEQLISDLAQLMSVPIHTARLFVDIFGRDGVKYPASPGANGAVLKSPTDQAIYEFIKSSIGSAVSTKQICKHVGKSQQQIVPHLKRMVAWQSITRMRRGFYSFSGPSVVLSVPEKTAPKAAKQLYTISEYSASCQKIHRLLGVRERSAAELAKKASLAIGSVFGCLKQLIEGGHVKKVSRGVYGLV